MECLPEIQAPYAADLTRALEAVCERYTNAIKETAERHLREAQEAEERQLDAAEVFLNGLHQQAQDLLTWLQRELNARKEN